MILAILALSAQHAVHHGRRPPRAPVARPELLHVTSIDLSGENGTTFKLRDAHGVALEPVTVPLTVCRKDHLGRLLPGNDVALVVDDEKAADGSPRRSVKPERFAGLCD